MDSSGKRIGAWAAAVGAGGLALFGVLWGAVFLFASPLAGVAIWVASALMLCACVLSIPKVRSVVGDKVGGDLSGGVGVAVVGAVVFVSVLVFVGGTTGGMMAVPTDASDAGSSLDDSDAGGSQSGSAATDTPEPDAAEFAVRIGYAGDWQGAVSVTGGGSSQTESISGSGTEVVEITGDVDIISANAQKQDDSSQELTVQILQDGQVIAEADTASGYGVAQVSESV